MGSPLVEPGQQDAMIQWLTDRLNALEQTSVIPVGILAYCPAAVPGGWLACDGSTISSTRYGQLVAYLGSTTLPDISGRVVAGKAASGTFATMLGTGGAETVTLLGTQSGQPGFTTASAGAHTHTVAGYNSVHNVGQASILLNSAAANWGSVAGGVESAGAHTHTVSAASAAASHSNVQPFIVLQAIIKF